MLKTIIYFSRNIVQSMCHSVTLRFELEFETIDSIKKGIVILTS